MAGSKARDRVVEQAKAREEEQPREVDLRPSTIVEEGEQPQPAEAGEDVDGVDEDVLDLPAVVVNEFNDGYPRPARLEMYRGMYTLFHRENPKKMGGKMPHFKVKAIAKLVKRLKERRSALPIALPEIRLLDYGSGKGYQYLKQRVHEHWGNLLPHCYDPGVVQLWERPQGEFDGIICTDVMEHLEAQDVLDTLRDIFAYTPRERPSFVYLHICCRPASKFFSDGRNVHLTVESPKWWEHVIQPFKDEHPLVHVATSYEVAEEGK